MEKRQAVLVSDCLEQWNKSRCSTYELIKLETSNNTLTHFHQWANGKPVVSAFDVSKPGDERYYFLFIDWHRNDNYYLVIYAHDKSTTIAELNKTVEEDGDVFLSWTYNPLKRDGKNAIRKAYFKQTFGETTMKIALPTSISDVEMFLDQVFKLCHNRLRADRVVEIYDFE